ncbi:sialoadhesin-like protein [Lates japonicus]|uniref:Sialoadhesin-like protein n=1 Tax=Lates japonicus TaxID=270547 RepID=A0AAD3NHR1_LATJO|nr:sialoadhesin-like protein [Lates japonicus]
MKATLLLLLLLIHRRSAHGRASVKVVPNKSQFSEYDNILVSCEHFGSGEWTVWRYTTQSLELSQCGSGWGILTSSTCEMTSVKPASSGVYWCESKHRQSSNAVSITITDDSDLVFLTVSPDSSQLSEYENLSLSCGDNSSSHGWRIKRFPHAGDPSNHKVSSYGDTWETLTSSGCSFTLIKKSVSAVYWYTPSSHPESAPSELRLLRVIRYMVVISPYLVSTVLMVSKYRRRPTERTSPVSMTTPPPTEDDERPDRESNDDTADVTTEHHF